jgi:hypothetical protein
MTDVAEDTSQLQNAVRSFLSAMEPEESVAFASLVYFYNRFTTFVTTDAFETNETSSIHCSLSMFTGSILVHLELE